MTKEEIDASMDTPFAKIKFAVASIQFNNLSMNEDKTAIEANASTHRIAEYILEYAKQEAIDFSIFCVRGFWYNDETDLWESFQEGKTFVINGKELFRFSTTELFNLFKSKL